MVIILTLKGNLVGVFFGWFVGFLGLFFFLKEYFLILVKAVTVWRFVGWMHDS